MSTQAKNLWVQENYVNVTEGLFYGDAGPYETHFTSKGDLYKSCALEYGRCQSKVYIDKLDGKSRAIGWVFVKRVKYTDCADTYLRETWVTVHTQPPTVTKQYHYA